MNKNEVKIRKILNELKKTAPNPINRAELCKNINMMPEEVSYLFRVYPDKFTFVEVDNDHNSIRYRVNMAFLVRFK